MFPYCSRRFSGDAAQIPQTGLVQAEHVTGQVSLFPLESLGHEVIVANAPELRALTGSDRKSDPEDARKLALHVRVDRGARKLLCRSRLGGGGRRLRAIPDSGESPSLKQRADGAVDLLDGAAHYIILWGEKDGPELR